MLKKFQKYSFSSIYITAIIAVLIWLGAFINPSDIDVGTQHSPLFQLFINWFSVLGRGTAFVSFLIILFQATVLVFFTNKYKIFEQDTYMTGLIFVIFSSIPQIQVFNAVVVANIFVILAISILISTISEKKSSQSFFLMAIFLAIASLIYYQYIFISIFAVISVVVIRSKVTKEIFAVILGFIIIYLLYAELFYLTQNHGIKFSDIFDVIKQKGIKINDSIYFIIFISFIGTIFLFSNTYIFKNLGYKEIDNRTVFQLLFSFFIFSVLSYLIIPSIGMEFLGAIAIPLTFLFGNYFMKLKDRFFNRILFFLFLISGLVFNLKHLITLF